MEDFNENEIVFDESEIKLDEPMEAKSAFSEDDIVFNEADIEIESDSTLGNLFSNPADTPAAKRDQEARDQQREDVKILADEQGINQEEESVTAKDIGAATMSGAADLYDTTGYAIEAAGDYFGVEGVSTYGKAAQETGKEAKAYWDSAKSPQALAAERKKFSVTREDGSINPEKTFLNIVKNPGKIALSVGESLAATGAGMATGGFITKGFTLIPKIGTGIAAAMGYGLGEGAISAAGGGKEVEEKINKMTFEKLALHPEFRAALIETKGDKEAARNLVARAGAGDAAAFNMLTTTILSSPMGYAFSPIFSNKGNISTNFLDSLAIGITGEGAQETTQSAAEKAGQNLAIQQKADLTQDVGEGVSEAAIAGGLSGAAMGGGITTAAEAYTIYDGKKQAKVRQEHMRNYAMGFDWTSLTPQQQQLKESLKEFDFTSLTPEQQQQKADLQKMFFTALSPEQMKAVEEENARIEDIQTRFKKVILGNPDAEIPSSMIDDVDMQERLLKEIEEEDPEDILGRKEPTFTDHVIEQKKQEAAEEEALKEIDNFFMQERTKSKTTPRVDEELAANEKLYSNDEDLLKQKNKEIFKSKKLESERKYENMTKEELEAEERERLGEEYDSNEIEVAPTNEEEFNAAKARIENSKENASMLAYKRKKQREAKEQKPKEPIFDIKTTVEGMEAQLKKIKTNRVVPGQNWQDNAHLVKSVKELETAIAKKKEADNDKLSVPQEAEAAKEKPKSTISELEAELKSDSIYKPELTIDKAREYVSGIPSEIKNLKEEIEKTSKDKTIPAARKEAIFNKNKKLIDYAERRLQDAKDQVNEADRPEKPENGKNLFEGDSPELQASNIAETQKFKKFNYVDHRGNTKTVMVMGEGKTRGFVSVAIIDEDNTPLHEVGVRPDKLGYIEDAPKPKDTGDKVIGENTEGETLYEDENGARYYLDGSFGITEPMGVTPSGAEIPTNQERYDKSRYNYLTKEEFEELSGTKVEQPEELGYNEVKKPTSLFDINEEGVENDSRTKQAGKPSGADTDTASGKPGVSNQEQTARKQERVPGSDKAVPKDDKRPTGDNVPGSKETKLPAEDIGVAGLPTVEDAEYNEQEQTSGDTVLPKRDDGQPFNLIGLPPVELTKGQRKKYNEAAEEILKKPIEDVTDADREILRHYTGEGGLDEVNVNTINQHYTNYETVEAIYGALNNAGIPLGKVLEPAVGSGNFVGFHPGGTWDIVDIDERNVEITRRLYPNISKWSVESYETFKGKNYDAIISNVPFASEQMLMREHAMTILPAFKAIHNFYFAHSISKLKDNGVMAFMTSTGTMDGTTKARALRSYLMDKGDILAAYRLPEKSQAKNAHTDTMIDIIFIQKRPAGVESRQKDLNTQFINIGNKDGYPMNEYFIAHPENILGEQKIDKDKTKMGKVGWIATGTPNYSSIELDYTPYKKPKKSKEEKSNFVDLDGAREWAANNGLVFKTTFNNDTHMDIKADSVILYDTPVTFEETDQHAMFGTPNKSINAKKTIDLERIKNLTEEAVRQEDKGMLETAKNEIKAYQETYEKAPHKDTALRKFLNTGNAGIKLKEYMSYFDEDFTPAPIYGEKVRFKDSGQLEIKQDSPLEDKAIYYSDGNNEIDTSKSYPMLSAKDIKQLIDTGAYVQSGEHTIQLDFIYYSGNIYQKLDQVENMFANGHISKDQHKTQKAKLTSILPKPIKYAQIKFRGTESWLPERVKNALVVDKDGVKIVRQGILANFTQEQIYNRYLDHKALAPQRKDETEAENIERTKLYEEMLHKEILPQLKNYVESKGLVSVLEEEYNRNANFYSRPEMTGRLLRKLPKTFRGKKFDMQGHQKEGAEKIVFNKKGVLAFAPGGGKTITAIVAVKQLLDQGVMKKPLFVVPVNTIAQWEESVRELYPDANVYEFPKIKSGKNKGKAKEWKDLTKEDKEQMVYDLANNRYDFTIIGDTMMQKVGLSEEVMDRYIDDLVDEISAQEEAQEGEEQSKKKKKGEVSAAQKKKALKQGIKMAYGASSEFDFAKLGFDGIIADEVQYYKNIGMQGRDTEGGLGANITITYKDREGKTLKAKDIEAGAQPYSATLGSFRSYDFRFKTKYVSENNNGNNVILLTGTPTPNKPLELMTLLQHLDPKILEEYGIKSSSDFVETFFEIGEDETINSAGATIKKKELVSMKNQQFLRNILERYVDYRGFNDMKDLPRPEQIDVKHYLKLSKAGETIMQDVQHRILKAIEDGKQVKQGNLAPEDVEIALVGMGAGRSASIDLRLYSVGSKEKSQYTKEEAAQIIAEDIQTEDNNKILKTISLVTAQYKENPNSGQIIFLDRLTVENEDGSKTSTHQEIREKILATGLFDKDEVIFANGQEHVNPQTGEVVKSSPSADRLNLIMDMYNEGKIKVVIGNTAKLGVGVDLNRKTTDIYQLDIPYRPDEIEQRNNRGVRQGNENKQVRTHQFFQLGTFDERSYKIVMDKRGFNDVYGFTDNEAVELDETGSVKVDTGEAVDPYQAVIDLESDPFERERLRKQRTLDNAKKNDLNIRKAINTLENTHRIKKSSIKNYEDAIVKVDEELKPANYPKYEGAKDAAERKEKIEKHIERLKERKEKYLKTIFDIKAEVKTLEGKIEGRKEQLSSLAAEAAFIKEEYTTDGEYVDYGRITEAFTEKVILQNEEEEKAAKDAPKEEAPNMRPAFINLGAVAEIPFAVTGLLNNAKNKLDNIVSESLTGKIKDTKIDDFIRKRLGGSQAGLGLLTRAQEKDFITRYRRLQAKLAQADISAEEKAKIIEDSQGSIETDIFNMVSIQYLENPEAREVIREEYPELVAALDEIREYINNLSKEAMERGLILPSQFNKWKDRYLSRLYLLTQKPQVAAKVSSGIKLYEQKSGRKIDSIIDYIMENGEEADRLGAVLEVDKAIKVTIAKTQGNIGLEDFLRGIAENNDLVDSNHLVTLDQDIANLPKSFSPDYAKQVVIPYIQDEIYILDKTTHLTADMYYIAQTEAKIESLNSTIEHIEDGIKLANAYMELSEDTDKAKLPTDKRYGALSGLYVSKDVASLVQSQFSIVNNPEMLVDKIDHAGKKLLVYFKWAKVPANIFAYPRNFASNLFQWSMSGADPARFIPGYTAAIFSIIKKDKWYQNALKGGVLGTNAISAEVNDALKVMAEELSAGRTKTKKLYNAMQKVGDAYGLVDDIAKIARIKYAMEQDGLDLEEAVNVAQLTHYDYSLTYDLIRGMRDPDFKRGMALKLIGTLFPTYTHKTIAYVYDTMIHRPVTLALIGAALAMLTGGSDDDRDKIGHKKYDKIMETMPEWTQKNPLIRVDMEKSGNHTEVTLTDISYIVPFGSLLSAVYQTLHGDPVGGASNMGLAGTPLHMIGGLLTNRDAFSGKEIYYEHDQYEKYKDISMYVAKQWAPGTFTKLYSLSETRHPIIPRLIGINSYVYQDNELRAWKQHGAERAKLDAGKRVLFYKRKNTQARKKMMSGDISKQEYIEIRNKNLSEIKRWKKIGIEAYKQKKK